MSDTKEQSMGVSQENTNELTEKKLEDVQGGNSISILTKMPNYQGPKLHAPDGSIAQGDTLDNTLTFDQLPS